MVRIGLTGTNMHTGWPKKLALFFCTPKLYQILTDFHNYFTVRIKRKFVIILSRDKDPTAPQVCRYTTFWNVKCLKTTIFVHHNFIDINRFSKFYLLILLPVPSDVITDVTHWHL